MSSVQIVYASRHGGTAGIAQRLGAQLQAHGHRAVVVDAADHPDPNGFDAHVIGSGVYMGSWLEDALGFLERHAPTLAQRRVWLFSSGPLPHPSKSVEADDPLERALGPESGPGSGGRRKVAALSDALRPRQHRVFIGAFDPNDPPKSMLERVVRMMPAAKRVLPAGDFRDWDAIDAWAAEISNDLVPRSQP